MVCIVCFSFSRWKYCNWNTKTKQLNLIGFGVDQNEIQKYMYTLRWLEYLERNLSVACFKIVPYSEDEMTGLAILYTLTKDEYSKQIPIVKTINFIYLNIQF